MNNIDESPHLFGGVVMITDGWQDMPAAGPWRLWERGLVVVTRATGRVDGTTLQLQFHVAVDVMDSEQIHRCRDRTPDGMACVRMFFPARLLN